MTLGYRLLKIHPRNWPVIFSIKLAHITDPLWWIDDDLEMRHYPLIALNLVRTCEAWAISLFIGPLNINFAWKRKP